MTTVYFIRNEETDAIKIGKCDDDENLIDRLQTLQTANSAQLKILATTKDYSEAELHQRFADFRIRNEWFRPGERLVKFIITAAEKYANKPVRKRDYKVTVPSNWKEYPAKTASRVATVIKKLGPISHWKLQQTLSSRIQAKDLKVILEALENNGYISAEYREVTGKRGGKYYKYIKHLH